jgi:hypothetical protein
MDIEDCFRHWKKRPCICGSDNWEECSHGATQFRGHPSKVEPYAQWARENLPSSRQGITHIDDDHVIGNFQSHWLGFNTIVSLKTHGKEFGDKERLTMQRHLDQPRRCIHLSMDGNTPGQLKHYPVTVDGAPEPIRVSSRILWQKQVGDELRAEIEITEKQLVKGLLLSWWAVGTETEGESDAETIIHRGRDGVRQGTH